jgi:hypothetical protein
MLLPVKFRLPVIVMLLGEFSTVEGSSPDISIADAELTGRRAEETTVIKEQVAEYESDNAKSRRIISLIFMQPHRSL